MTVYGSGRSDLSPVYLSCVCTRCWLGTLETEMSITRIGRGAVAECFSLSVQKKKIFDFFNRLQFFCFCLLQL